jgi:hypothetical protein
MSRGYDEEAMKPMPRIGPPPPWWRKWMVLALFLASAAVVPVVAWLLR